jgi:hypothetical protein
MGIYHLVEPILVALIGLASLAWSIKLIAPALFAKLIGHTNHASAPSGRSGCGSGGCSSCTGCGLSRVSTKPKNES